MNIAWIKTYVEEYFPLNGSMFLAGTKAGDILGVMHIVGTTAGLQLHYVDKELDKAFPNPDHPFRWVLFNPSQCDKELSMAIDKARYELLKDKPLSVRYPDMNNKHRKDKTELSLDYTYRNETFIECCRRIVANVLSKKGTNDGQTDAAD